MCSVSSSSIITLTLSQIKEKFLHPSTGSSVLLESFTCLSTTDAPITEQFAVRGWWRHYLQPKTVEGTCLAVPPKAQELHLIYWYLCTENESQTPGYMVHWAFLHDLTMRPSQRPGKGIWGQFCPCQPSLSPRPQEQWPGCSDAQTAHWPSLLGFSQ